MFSNCNSLISLPDLSKWNTKNLLGMKGLLSDCISLSFCPDLTKWNNFNINDINLTPNYKKIEKFVNLNYEYSTILNHSEVENYDKIYNDNEFFDKLKREKYERLYN